MSIVDFALLETIEGLHMENAALRVLLDGARDPHMRNNWKNEFNDMIKYATPEIRKSAHVLFEPVYAYIEELGDDLDLAALLEKLPVKGKVN